MSATGREAIMNANFTMRTMLGRKASVPAAARFAVAEICEDRFVAEPPKSCGTVTRRSDSTEHGDFPTLPTRPVTEAALDFRVRATQIAGISSWMLTKEIGSRLRPIVRQESEFAV
jgi:hypothetical protein